MYLIVGLGNPESDYSNTRHNMGFDVINKLAEKYGIEINRNKYEGIYGSGNIGEEKVVLVKPQTYMNSSGKSICEFVRFYKIDLKNLIVVFDDMSIEKGKIRIRKQGSAGGHHGVESTIEYLGNSNFNRIRIGIGRPQGETQIVSYVLDPISKDERKILDTGIEKGVLGVEEIIKKGIDIAMNDLNREGEKC